MIREVYLDKRTLSPISVTAHDRMMDATADVTFEAPGPGAWELDATHRGRRPMTPFVRDGAAPGERRGGLQGARRAIRPAARRASRAELVARVPLPARRSALGEGDRRRSPSRRRVLVMKIVARLHPEMRRRNRAAAQAWRERALAQGGRSVGSTTTARDVVATNLAFQRVDLAALDDDELRRPGDARARALRRRRRDELRDARRRSHPGRRLSRALPALGHRRRRRDRAAAGQLAGDDRDRRAARAGRAGDRGRRRRRPSPVDGDSRARAGRRRRRSTRGSSCTAWRLVTSDDIDKPTLAERPNLQLAALLAAPNAARADARRRMPTALRGQGPGRERDTFDELLGRSALRHAPARRQRRRAVELVGRLAPARAARGGAPPRRRRAARRTPTTSSSCTPDELGPLLLHRTGPSADEIAARAARSRSGRGRARARHARRSRSHRRRSTRSPRAMARATAALLTVMEAEGLAAAADRRAAVAGPASATAPTAASRGSRPRADDALDRLEPGDVLVAPFTGPSYNSILPILGALVVDAGGTDVPRRDRRPRVRAPGRHRRGRRATARSPTAHSSRSTPCLGDVRILTTDDAVPECSGGDRQQVFAERRSRRRSARARCRSTRRRSRAPGWGSGGSTRACSRRRARRGLRGLHDRGVVVDRVAEALHRDQVHEVVAQHRLHVDVGAATQLVEARRRARCRPRARRPCRRARCGSRRSVRRAGDRCARRSTRTPFFVEHDAGSTSTTSSCRLPVEVVVMRDAVLDVGLQHRRMPATTSLRARRPERSATTRRPGSSPSAS